MKLGPTFILRGAIVAMGLFILILCLFALPAGIASDNTGDYRFILACLYVPAIPFFYALHQAMKLLDYIDKNKAFTKRTVEAFQNIKFSALIIGVLFTLGMPYVFYVADKDDAPGVVALGLIIVFASFVIATFAGVMQKLFQNAVKIKSENDLTV